MSGNPFLSSRLEHLASYVPDSDRSTCLQASAAVRRLRFVEAQLAALRAAVEALDAATATDITAYPRHVGAVVAAARALVQPPEE